MVELESVLRDALLCQDPVAPASSPLAHAVAALDGGGDLRLDHLARLVVTDPAAAADLLASAPRAGELSLADAAQRAGDAVLLRIARDAVRAAPPAGPLASLRDRAWRTSVVSALLCRELARARGLDRDVAYACGLLHRIGAVAALAAFERLAAGARPARAVPLSTWQRLADRWRVPLGLAFAQGRRLPVEVTDAISCCGCDGEESLPRSPILAVVRSVDALVAVLGGVDPADAIDLARLSDPEADLLSLALDRSEAYLDGLARLAPPPAGAGEPRSPASSLRERKGTGVRLRLAGREYAGVGFAAHQLLVSGPAPLWEGVLLEVEVLDRRRRAFHARVLVAWAEGDRFGALLVPFGLSGPALADMRGVLPVGAEA
jgi:HDOD domain